MERPTALLRLLYEKSPEAVVETLAAERCLTDPALERRQEAITIVRQAMAKHVPNRPGGSPWFAATDALSAAGFLNQRAMELHASDAAVARQQRTMQTFADFWPFYLREHSRPGTRALHLVGTSLSLLLVIFAAALHRPALLLAAVICGYAFAWVGHFFVEHNKPASFKYPLWSFAADWKMWALALSGRLGGEVRRALEVQG